MSETCPACGSQVTPIKGATVEDERQYEPDTTEVERLKALLLDISVGYELTPKLQRRVREALG